MTVAVIKVVVVVRSKVERRIMLQVSDWARKRSSDLSFGEGFAAVIGPRIESPFNLKNPVILIA